MEIQMQEVSENNLPVDAYQENWTENENLHQAFNNWNPPACLEND